MYPGNDSVHSERPGNAKHLWWWGRKLLQISVVARDCPSSVIQWGHDLRCSLDGVVQKKKTTPNLLGAREEAAWKGFAPHPRTEKLTWLHIPSLSDRYFIQRRNYLVSPFQIIMQIKIGPTCIWFCWRQYLALCSEQMSHVFTLVSFYFKSSCTIIYFSVVKQLSRIESYRWFKWHLYDLNIELEKMHTREMWPVTRLSRCTKCGTDPPSITVVENKRERCPAMFIV